MTLQDSDFIDGVESDVKGFVKSSSPKRVLVFPPVNNYRRFLIHKLIEEEFKELKTFSIGEGDDRRTVICYKEDYKEPQITEAKPSRQLYSNSFSEKKPVSSRLSAENGEDPKRAKRARTMPSVSIYRPPAARKLENENGNTSRETVTDSSPKDKQQPQPQPPKCKTEESTEDNHKKSESSGISMFRNAITSIRTQNQSPPKCNGKKLDDGKKSPLKPEENKSMNNGKTKKRPDMQVYVPKGRRIVETKVPVKDKSPDQIKKEEKTENNSENGVPTSPVEKSPETPVYIEAAQTEVKTEEKKRDDSSQPYEDSDSTAVSSSSDNSSSNSLRNSCEKISEIKDNNNKKSPPPAQLNPDECDWETMFDDTGECLNPNLLEQLSGAVGQVAIVKPKSNYDEYKTKSLDSVADEFPHVVEIYNFPPEFQLQDLMLVFSQFKNSGFEIKWVDDTHALGIFASSKIVSEVLAFHHPFVKTRSLKEGTPLSKTKARRSAESLLPYKPRPDTCPALARRLVTGALGVKLPTSREEREAEKKILKIAREKKRLEAKQKEEAWEGTFS